MPAASAATATVAMPSPLTSSGLYGWRCIGWVMVNFICLVSLAERRRGPCKIPRDIYTIICKAGWATAWSVSPPQRSDAVGHRDHELGNGLRSRTRDHLRLRHQPGELAQDLSRQCTHRQPARDTAADRRRPLAGVRGRR